MWSEYETYTSPRPSANINQCLSFHTPIDIRPKFPRAWFICAPCRHGPDPPSRPLLTSCQREKPPQCRSRNVWQEIEKNRKWREITFDEMDWHYPIMVNRREKEAAAFLKCHFGNFRLTSDHNSLSSTFTFFFFFFLFSAQWKTSLLYKLLFASTSVLAVTPR